MDSNRYDAIVIGAGPSGLAAGIRLAQFEKRVVVLERHALCGGLNSYFKRGGRRFDTGLHALTNFVPKGTKGAPLTKLLRQLRIGYDELALGEQGFSRICHAGLTLRFSNQLGLLESEVAAAFPSQVDGFARLLREVREFDAFDPRVAVTSARAELGRFVTDPVLVEALLLPIAWYGSAREDDVDWYQFVILFRSVFLEGFARPEGGIKTLLDLLVARFRACGGELRLRAPVQRIRLDAHGVARGVVLENGDELESDCVLSSAGGPETLALAGRSIPPSDVGRLSFVETVHVTDRPCRALGHEATITFFNDSPTFGWRRPDGLVDTRTGVICSSDNYASATPSTEGVLRITTLANHDRWCELDEESYAASKRACEAAVLEAAAAHAFDPRPHSIQSDTFTPRTIRHYTARSGGAVYGSPHKRRDGHSGIENLFLIGTDQGLLGIVGALLSGVTMANQHALASTRGVAS